MEQTCPRCGTRNASSARFCKVDGTALSQEAQPARTDARVCPGCGTANPPTAKFCKADGFPLDATTASAAPPRMRRAIWPAVTAVATLVIAAGGGLAWWLFGTRTPAPLEVAGAASAPRTDPPLQATPPAVAVPIPGAAPESTTAAAPAPAEPPPGVPPVASLPPSVGRFDPQARTGVSPAARLEPPTAPVISPPVSPQAPVDPPPRARVEPPPAIVTLPNPAELEININRALRGGQIDGITAQVGEDGAVTLRGQTGSLAEKERAFRIARTVRGVSAAKDLVWVAE